MGFCKGFFVVISLLLINCASTVIKTQQFIDVDETLKLEPKMKKSNILQNIGEPIEVRAGLLTKNGDVIEIWEYYFKEKVATVDINETDKKLPLKYNASLWGNPKRYSLFFLNGELIKWGYLKDVWEQYKDSSDIIAPIENSKIKVVKEQKGFFLKSKNNNIAE